MTIKVLVNGASGKMGRETVKALEHDDAFILVGKCDREDDLAEAIVKSGAQVVVDFTASSVGFTNANIIIHAGARPVIGTTGFSSDQIEELQKRCAKKKLGGIIAPNFSIAMILMMQCAQRMAHYFPHAEIIEMHHQTKEESPSGTAIRTAELIAQARRQSAEAKKSRELIDGARGAQHKNVHLHSVRLPGLVAHQMIIFGGRGETLTLRHDSLHRESFMPGVKLACKKVMEIDQLVYGLEHFLA